MKKFAAVLALTTATLLTPAVATAAPIAAPVAASGSAVTDALCFLYKALRTGNVDSSAGPNCTGWL